MKNKFILKHVSIPLIKMWRNLKSNLKTRRVLWGFVFFLLTTFIVGASFLPAQADLVVGQPSPKKYKAPRSIVFESEVQTEKSREEAAQQVTPVYKIDSQVQKDLNKEIGACFDSLQKIAMDSSMEKNKRVQKIQDDLGISQKCALFVVEYPEQLASARANLQLILGNFLGEGVKKNEEGSVREKIVLEIGKAVFSQELQSLSIAVFEKIDFRSNMEYDPVATANRVREAKESIAPVYVTVHQNEEIVNQGEIVTKADLEVMEKLGVLGGRHHYLSLVGLALLILVIYVFIFFYIYRFKKQIYEKDALFVLLGLLILLTLVLARTVAALDFGTVNGPLGGYLIPLAAGSMLIAILLDTDLAIFVTVILGILSGIITGNNLHFTVLAVGGGLAGVYSVSHLSQRTDLVKASLYIVLTNTMIILAAGLILRQPMNFLLLAMAMGTINGIFSSVLTIGLLPFLETAFGITSPVRLLELSNPNQPILKRLLLEAPGTYHHSVMVASLAETAASAVNANSLLARVGGYYHDIGKLKRPYFFVENQLAVENPHDKLTPTLSVLIITSHIKDGLEIVREEKLPGVVADIVEQHHGTGLLSFFYHKALESASSQEVNDEEFRYENPKPQTKEAAIVMLADTVEAGVRSLQNPNPGRMEGFIRKVIKEKLEDGQLEQSDLTLRELNVIATAFVRVLSGAFHSRVEYPDSILKEMERRKKNAAIHSKSAG